jgi:allophanate hydrolase
MQHFDFQISALREGYRAGRYTPEDVASAVIAGCNRYSSSPIWISRVPAEEVVQRARALMQMPGAIDLPLYGVPFAVKDNIDVAGVPTTAACPAFAYTPTEHSTVVARLIDAGAILIGKTNMDQFATGLVGTRSPYGAPSCVFDPSYISGGSSSGSGVAVGAHLVSFSLGTDTAGSGRVPAAFNNVVGLKPTRGLLSTRGVIPACRSLDCVSIFAASTGDALDVLRVAAAFDVGDPFSRAGAAQLLPIDVPRVGILAERDRSFHGDVEAEALYQCAIEEAAALGWRCVEFDYAPFRDAARLLYGGPRVGERLAAIADFVRDHAEAMDPVVRGIIENAGNTSNVDAYQAEYRLREYRRATDFAWRDMDAMLLPTTPTIFTKAELEADPIRLNSVLGEYTNFVNLIDLCAVAVPAGFRPSSGLPFGVTVIAPAFADEATAILADRLHRAIGAGFGVTRRAPATQSTLSVGSLAGAGFIKLAVAGAHLSGMALNAQLTDLGAVLLKECRTAPDYRLYALPGTVPPKPGLARDPGYDGAGITVEVWLLTTAAFGAFVSRLPQPMGIGKVALDDHELVSGFLCESYVLKDAKDITEYGGWRQYLNEAGP